MLDTWRKLYIYTGAGLLYCHCIGAIELEVFLKVQCAIFVIIKSVKTHCPSIHE